MIKKDIELKINGCFLLGTGYQLRFLLKIIKIIVKSNCKKVGEQNSSKLIDSLAFDNYNKKFKPIETNIDWLLKNKIERDKYLNDSMVLKHISSGLFRELLTGMIFTNNKSYQLHIDYPVKMMQ